MNDITSRRTRKVLASLAILTPMMNSAFADPPTAAEIESLHKTLEGKHVSGKTKRGGDLFWDNDPSGKMTMTANSPPGDKNWSIRFPGEWTVDEQGRYCVQGHAQVNQGGDWKACKKLDTAPDGTMSYDVSSGQHFTIK